MSKRRLKKIVFVAIPLLLTFAAGEGIVRIMHIPAIQDEPYFFGFSGTPKYFQTVERRGEIRILSTNPRKDIAQDSFRMPKPSDTIRIFTLGGSATYGEPYGPEGSFSRWLEDRLSLLRRDNRVEVINCGRKGFGSVRVSRIFDEIVRYDPDLILVYYGNNEYRDYRFHRIEIRIEISPFFRALKRFMDRSHIFRMCFALFFKKRVTSAGAQQINRFIASGVFDPGLFNGYIDLVQQRRDRLDTAYGGTWVSKLDHSRIEDDPDFETVFSKFNWRNELVDIFQTVLERSTLHICRTSRKNGVPVMFLTRARNFFYNRDDRRLFQKYDDANRIIRNVCLQEQIPCIETVPLLLETFGEELGFNAFTDEVHPTLRMNQILARAVAERMIQNGFFPDMNQEVWDPVQEKADMMEADRLDDFQRRGQVWTLLGWQKLVTADISETNPSPYREIVALAERAIRIDPSDYQNYLAYILLGTVSAFEADTTGMKAAWQRMREQFGSVPL